MARIILTEIERDMTPYRRILVDTTSKFSDHLKSNQRIVKESDGTIHFVKETLEEINQMIFEAEATERNCDINYKKQQETFEKTLQIQEEMLQIMKWFAKKAD